MEKEAWEFVQLSSKKAVRRSRAEPEPELWEGGESGAYAAPATLKAFAAAVASPSVSPWCCVLLLRRKIRCT